MRLSIIIPAWNESQRIGKTLHALRNYFANAAYSYEILVVDDGSTDATASRVHEFQKTITHLSLIASPAHKGKGAAVQRGMLAATGDLRLFTDADLAVSIEELPRFIEAIQNGADVAIASIEVPGATVRERADWYRRFLGKLAKPLIRALALPKIRDSQRGFKLFTKEAAEQIFPQQTIPGWGFDIEILAIAAHCGFRITEIPVAWVNAPESKVKLYSFFTTLAELMKIKWNLLRNRYR